MRTVNLKSEFFKYVLVLMSGTIFAQVLNFFFQPIISRIYTPEESAELGLFFRIITFAAAIATAKYDLALPVVKLDVHSFRLYRFTLRLLATVSTVALVYALGMQLYVEGTDQRLFYILIPLGILALSIYNLGTNWAIRTKQFKSISYSKVINTLAGNGLKIGFGLAGIGYIGLILGTVVGLFFSSIFFLQDYLKSSKIYNIKGRSKRNLVLAKQYLEFPKINLPHTLLDLSRDLILATVIWQLFGQKEYGLYNMTYVTLRLPLVVIGASLSQVYFQKCSDKVNGGESILKLTTQTIKTLFLISILPFGILFFFGEEMYGWFFSDNWSESGKYAEIMAPWFMIVFILSPVTMVPTILKRQKHFFYVAIFGAALMLACAALPNIVFEADIYDTLLVMSIGMSLYLVYIIFVIFGYVKKGVRT